MKHLSEQDNSPSRRALLLLGIVAAFWGVWTWNPTPTGIWHDDGVYLLIAKSLASGDGLRYAGVAGTPLAAKFPPLYSLVLTPFWWLGEDLAAGSGWVSALNVVFLATAISAFMWAATRAFDLGTVSALVLVAAGWTLPSLWRLTAIPLSEPIFVLWLVLGLITSQRLFVKPTPNSGARNVLPFLATFGLAYYTRTAGIALLAAVVAGLLWRKSWRQAGRVSVGGVLVMLPWTLWSRHATETIDPSLQDLLGSYGGWLISQALAAPDLYREKILQNAGELASAATGALVPGASGIALVLVGTLALPLAGVGAARAWRSNPTWCLLPAAYLGILLLWPYRSARLLAPILPFVITLVALGGFELLRLAPTPRRRRALAAVLGAAALWLSSSNLWTMAQGEHLRPYVIRSRTLAQAVEVVNATAGPSAIIGAPELWAALHLHTGRTVLPSARFLPLAKDGPPWGTPEQQYAMWSVGRVDHILVEHGGQVHGPALDRLDQVCSAGTVELLASFPGPSHFVRLNGFSECWHSRLR